MKKYHRKKHRIYTVVVGKKRPWVFICIVMALVICIGLIHFMPKQIVDIYENFYRLCVEKLPEDKSYDASGVYAYITEPYTIMSYVSPVFTKPEAKKEIKKSETKEEAPPENRKINEKSIVSRGLEIKNETDYVIDAAQLVKQDRNYTSSGNEPKVLIVHTHACETYSAENSSGLGSAGTYRTTDTDKNMVSIGEKINDIFIQNGINVIHDKTLCDYPSYNSSYVKSLEVIEWYLERYPSIEFVFDIHRDAIADDDGTPTKLTCNINGETAAQAMIVCGTDAMGLSNPYWKDNLILALKIQKNLEEMYPGFMRPVNLRKERFNMHKTKGSLLFEVGTHGNTHKEAMLAAEYLADGIVKTLKNK